MDSSQGRVVSIIRTVCTNCQKEVSTIENTVSDCNYITTENKCINWLHKNFNSSESSSLHSSETSVSLTDNTSESQSTKDDENDRKIPIRLNDTMAVSGLEGLDLINTNFNNVRINDCATSHVGNVTNIYGNVYVTENRSIVNQQSVTNQVFIEPPTVIPRGLFILDRRRWLAQPPLEEKEYLDKPAKYVIICHTETEEGFTQDDNILLVRGMQTYHIKSMKWNDIGYNFLVGCDGIVYEGRGWNVIGAHTFGYNNISIGIAFVGCFTTKLPPPLVLEQAKALIKRGVEIDAIDKEYRLVAHCQCRPFESPGRRLYEELKTWDHWYNIEDSQSI